MDTFKRCTGDRWLAVSKYFFQRLFRVIFLGVVIFFRFSPVSSRLFPRRPKLLRNSSLCLRSLLSPLIGRIGKGQGWCWLEICPSIVRSPLPPVCCYSLRLFLAGKLFRWWLIRISVECLLETSIKKMHGVGAFQDIFASRVRVSPTETPITFSIKGCLFPFWRI